MTERMCFLIDHMGTVVTELEFKSRDNKDLARVASEFFWAGRENAFDLWVIAVWDKEDFKYFLRYPNNDMSARYACKPVESEGLAIAMAHAFTIMRDLHARYSKNYYAAHLDTLRLFESDEPGGAIRENDSWVGRLLAQVLYFLADENPSILLSDIANCLSEGRFPDARKWCSETDKLECYWEDLYVLLWWGIKDHPWAALMRMQRQSAFLR